MSSESEYVVEPDGRVVIKLRNDITLRFQSVEQAQQYGYPCYALVKL